MNYGFIGAGNMAGAIIHGMISKTGGFSGETIYAYDISKQAVETLSLECGINHCLTSTAAVLASDVLVLAVKPNMLASVLDELKGVIAEKKPLVISIAAGKTIAFISDYLGNDVPIVRVMPNINAKVGAATCGFSGNAEISQAMKDIVISLFSTIGSITEIEEKNFGIFSALAGASPAFAYLYIDTLARAAQKAGMPKKQALELAAQTVCGSAKMVLESGEHPWSLIDQVCSPGGTTIEGIFSLQKDGFEASIIKAFDAVIAKDKLL